MLRREARSPLLFMSTKSGGGGVASIGSAGASFGKGSEAFASGPISLPAYWAGSLDRSLIDLDSIQVCNGIEMAFTWVPLFVEIRPIRYGAGTTA